MMETIWVIGRNTSIGKTTITSSLVRELGDRGFSCAAFKPFGVVRLWDRLDFIVNDMRDGQLYGPDAARLAESSDITSADLAEVVAPCYVLSYHEIHDVMLIRSGSAVLGNQQIRAIESARHLLDRHDVRRVLEQKRLLGKLTSQLNALRVAQATTMCSAVIAESYTYLRQLSAETIVCEGAGGFLPVWPGQDLPRAIVIVLASRILLATEIRESLRAQTEQGVAPRLTNPESFCRAYAGRVRSFLYPLSLPERVPEVAREMARTLLDHCD